MGQAPTRFFLGGGNFVFFCVFFCICLKNRVLLGFFICVNLATRGLEVGGWVKPQLGIFFLCFSLFFVCYFCTCLNKVRWGWVSGVWPIRGFFSFFSLTIPLIEEVKLLPLVFPVLNNLHTPCSYCDMY